MNFCEIFLHVVACEDTSNGNRFLRDFSNSENACKLIKYYQMYAH